MRVRLVAEVSCPANSSVSTLSAATSLRSGGRRGKGGRVVPRAGRCGAPSSRPRRSGGCRRLTGSCRGPPRRGRPRAGQEPWAAPTPPPGRHHLRRHGSTHAAAISASGHSPHCSPHPLHCTRCTAPPEQEASPSPLAARSRLRPCLPLLALLPPAAPEPLALLAEERSSHPAHPACQLPACRARHGCGA